MCSVGSSTYKKNMHPRTTNELQNAKTFSIRKCKKKRKKVDMSSSHEHATDGPIVQVKFVEYILGEDEAIFTHKTRVML